MRIFLHRKFEKKFVKLHPKVKKQFRERRNVFLENSFHPTLKNHPLGGDRKGEWSINVTGDWRAVYIFKDRDTVVFIDIDTHSNLYE